MKSEKIVIKLGSNLLIDSKFNVNKETIEWLAAEVEFLRKKSLDVAIITSGAVGVGRMMMRGIYRNSVRSDFDLRHKQALSAIGQPVLMKYYHEVFSEHNIRVAQVLLTKDDFCERLRYLNLRNTVLTLIELGVVPVINENDTVSTDEIKFGDNDNLSALVASKIGAAMLVILTDVEGLYCGEFKKENLIGRVEKITPEIEALAQKKTGSKFGTGGMHSKIQAAKIAVSSGVKTVLCRPAPLLFDSILKNNAVGTVFLPVARLDPKKRWIAFGAQPKGSILIDAGAVSAIESRGKSLLASGITDVVGNFKAGDIVQMIENDSKKEIARGLSYYSSEELEKIKGKHSMEISEILPASGYDEVVHRDNMVITGRKP